MVGALLLIVVSDDMSATEGGVAMTAYQIIMVSLGTASLIVGVLSLLYKKKK